MNVKRILGFVTLPLLAIAGMMLPQGLSGQTNDGAGVARLGGGPVAPTAPSPGMTYPSSYGPPGGYPAGSYVVPPQLLTDPSVAAYGTAAMPDYFGPGSAVGFTMTDPGSTALFGPQVSFDSNFGEGLGYTEEYYRLNAMIPWHIQPGQTVMFADIAAAVTSQGRGTYNAGLVYRNYDVTRNRIFGWNAYYDFDQGVRDTDGYGRIGVGVESLGKYLDFRANGYAVVGDDTNVISNQLVGDPAFVGHNILVTRERGIETAFDGFDVEAGGPLPFLGHYGLNGYVGGYYLDSDTAGDTVGVSARFEALINDFTTANFTYTNDDLLGSNAFTQVSVTLPRWRTQGWFKPRVMPERLGDPVRRSNRVHTLFARYRNQEAAINPMDGQPYELLYVDPDRTIPGDGSAESPFASLEALAAANGANYDVLSIAPRSDNTSENLTIDGGLDLFAGQQLLGRTIPHFLAGTNNLTYTLPPLTTDPGILRPLITNPSNTPGGYVVSLSDKNVVSGLRIDANGGRGIVSRGQIRDFEITSNAIFNHTEAVVLNNVRGNGVFTDNTLDGSDGSGSAQAASGMVLSAAAGETLNLLVQNNTVTDHTGTGIDIVAKPGSTIQADDPMGFRDGRVTGILENTTNRNGRGIRMEARTDAKIVASVEDNEFNENTSDGFLAIADAGRVVFRSFARNAGISNGGNGAFFHYRNGGRFYVQSEDANGNNVLDPGEDRNGNGIFDLGFVQNDLSGNGENGLCIFGEGSGRGFFDIGGPDPALGNTFFGNSDAGIATDLTGTSRAQMSTMFNTIAPGGGVPASLTFVLDFIEPTQASFVDFTGTTIGPFDPTNYGFAAGDFDLVANAVLDTVRDQFLGIPTSDMDPRSPIPPGMQLDIDFIRGDIGTAPGNNSPEYYTVVLGDAPNGPALGISDGIGQVRDLNGVGPNGPASFGQTSFQGLLGEAAVVVYTDQISTIGGLNPPNANQPNYRLGTANARVNGLTSGVLGFTRNAIGNVLTHEVGHSLSLRHVADAGAILPTPGATVVMGTGAAGFGQPNQALLAQQEFAYSANSPGELPGEAPFVQMDVQRLVDNLGLRAQGVGGGGQTRDGIRIRASDSARLDAPRILNNDISGLANNGISISMNDRARAVDVDVQGNNVAGNGGHGVRLEARGDRALIVADQSIGGNGTNTLGGNSYTQRNFISNNLGDGIQILAAQGGTIQGNVINNQIDGNSGNGVALLIEEYGTLEFGDAASNQVVQDNEITDNSGFGILVRTESVPGKLTTANVLTQQNLILNNASGGLFADTIGSNNNPPALASPVINSRLNLTVQNETFDGNAGVGVGVSTNGNTKADVLLQNNSITNTADGPTFGGDGIAFRRLGSSLLTANVIDNTVNNSFGDGMDTMYAGNNRFDVNQPMSGTINTITWNGNAFTNNGDNGVVFRGRGDAQLIADGMNNVISNNATNGILVDTREFSTFGDPSDPTALPPGRRTVFKSNVITNNGEDGIQLASFNNSRQLVHITSAASGSATSPHQGALSDGDTVIANNGSDGIHIDSRGNSDIDAVINSGAGNTSIINNGTGNNGGNGIRFDASGNTNSTVIVQDTLIAGNQAGASEDVNNNGVLDFGEDANRNGFLDTEDRNGNGNIDPGEDSNGNGVLDTEDTNNNGVLDGAEDATGNLAFVDGNLDIDVENGNGIAFFGSGNTTATLQVGGTGLGNVIQSNEDDGISVIVRGGLSALGSGATGQARPTINIQQNLIGGFDNGNPAGNGGDGLGLNIAGGAFPAQQLDGTIDANQQPTLPIVNAFFRNEIGPIVNATIQNNEFSQNGRRGANMRLTGAGGQREREFLGGTGPGGTTFDPTRITFTGNVARSNGEDGVVYQANARFIEGRPVALFSNGAPGAGNGLTAPYDPLDPGFFALNAGSLNGQSVYMSQYLHLGTQQNSSFVATGNEIKNNGTALLSGQGRGMVINVSPNAYVAADVQSNVFGGNLDADFETSSFNVGGNPIAAVDYINNAQVPRGFDIVFLDDTAQLDLRFDDNSGNQISVTADGAFYTNNDPGKNFFVIPNNNRPAALFQVDGGPFLNSPNNVFSFQGNTQNVRSAFSVGNYFERSISDPLFPNIAFPPPLL